MAIIRPAAAHDLARIEEIYDAIHTAEEAGNVSIGWVRGVYPTRATAQAALDAGEIQPDEVIYVWNIWDSDADIKEENHIYIRTVGAYAQQAHEAGDARPKEYFKYYHDEDEAMMAYADGMIAMHDPIKVWKELEIDGKKEHRIIDATVGRLIINDAIPQNLGFKKREKYMLFSPEECGFVNAADSENRFFTLWTMKEAYIKAEGGVLSDAAGLSLVGGGLLEAKLSGYHFETEKTDSYYLTVCYK